LKLVYSYLEQELTSSKKFDVILLPLNHGWNMLTPASREALKRRVRDGCGLVLVRPDRDELSPLTPVDFKVSESELGERQDPGASDSSPWRRVADHYITRAVPVETFPFGDVSSYLYRAEPGSKVLIQTASGNPVLALSDSGKGRVVAFGYRNQGLSWYMPKQARGHFVDVYWEYFYSLLCRSIIFAAGREPRALPDFNGSGSQWRLRDSYNRVHESGHGHPPEFTELAPGRYFLEQQVPGEWKITPIERGPIESISDLKAEPEIISEGSPVTVRWNSSRAARVDLVDGLDRVIARAEGKGEVRLSPLRPLTHAGYVRVTCGGEINQIPVRFAANSREWNDYEVIMPWYGPKSYQPWIPTLDEQFHRIGITTLADPERNFKLIVSTHLPGFGIYWYRQEAYVERKAEFAKTKDTKYVRREISLESPAFEAGIREQLDKALRPMAPLKPMASYLADESSLTFYGDAFDVDWSPESLAGFRKWLQNEYRSLESLNETWGTTFGNWDDVLPMTTEQAQKRGNFAPWADHREYMEKEFVKAFAKASDLVHQIDPDGRASISGTQVPTAHNGCDWYDIDQKVDYIQPYSDGDQDAMHYLFRPGLTITGFTGYGLVGEKAQYEQWQRLFFGHSGASLFWHYTLLNPDLTMSEQGKALAAAFGRIQSGIGRVFLNSTVHEDGVAIHFSMASRRGAWITDGKIASGLGNAEKTSKNFAELERRQHGWVQKLEHDGVQFRFVSTPQIESGMLDRYRVLILPYSIALSDKETQEIERFMQRGGIVYGDDQTGRMDAHCRWRKKAVWSDAIKGFVRSGPCDVGTRRDFGGSFLVTVRDFGASKLTGVLPEVDSTIRVPRSNAGTYDLLRGGLAGAEIKAGPDKPVLLLERKSRIAKVAIDKNLRITVLDDSGQPVDLSVARVEVFDPSGNLVRHYSSNVTVRNGKAQMEIAFALNDSRGAWHVRARDVISGLTAETVINR
jgi:Beta-galactosidase